MAKKKRYIQKDKAQQLSTTAPKLITQNLVIKPATRQTQDVGKWRRALQSADMGRRIELYNLYNDILIDPFLGRSIGKRIEAITNAELTFQIDGKAVEVMDDLIDTPEFEDMLREMMLSKFWGVTLLEFDFTNGFNFASIDRKHIRPKTKKVVIQESDGEDTGISYAGDQFFLQIGKDDDLGLIYQAAPYVIYKRGGYGDWAQYVELFGMPFRIGKYNPYDTNTQRILEDMLEKMGSAPYAAIPNDSEIDIKETRASGEGQLYDVFRKACNEEILVCVVGNTMTIINGSSKSQGEVHEEVESSINKADRRFIQRILNRRLLPLLEARGIAPSGGWFSFPEKEERVPLKDRIDIDIKVSKMVRVDPDYFYEKYNLPKPKDGNLIPDKAAGDQQDDTEDKEDTPANNEKPKPKPKEKPTAPKGKIGKQDKAEALSWWDSVRVKLADFFDRAHEG